MASRPRRRQCGSAADKKRSRTDDVRQPHAFWEALVASAQSILYATWLERFSESASLDPVRIRRELKKEVLRGKSGSRGMLRVGAGNGFFAT